MKYWITAVLLLSSSILSFANLPNNHCPATRPTENEINSSSNWQAYSFPHFSKPAAPFAYAALITTINPTTHTPENRILCAYYPADPVMESKTAATVQDKSKWHQHQYGQLYCTESAKACQFSLLASSFSHTVIDKPNGSRS